MNEVNSNSFEYLIVKTNSYRYNFVQHIPPLIPPPLS